MSKARKSRIQDGDEVRAANYERLCVLFNTFFWHSVLFNTKQHQIDFLSAFFLGSV